MRSAAGASKASTPRSAGSGSSCTWWTGDRAGCSGPSATSSTASSACRRRTPRPRPPAVRDALRALHRPGELARSPLAAGAGETERAAALRARLEAAIDDAFGDTHDERALREVLVRSYVDPAPTGEHAAHALHLSRATYYRRLRVATARVAAFVAQR